MYARDRVRWSTDARLRTPQATAADFGRSASAAPFASRMNPRRHEAPVHPPQRAARRPMTLRSRPRVGMQREAKS